MWEKNKWAREKYEKEKMSVRAREREIWREEIWKRKKWVKENMCLGHYHNIVQSTNVSSILISVNIMCHMTWCKK